MYDGQAPTVEAFAKRVCLVTGASGILGWQICEQFRKTHDVVGVHFRHPVMNPTQDQVFFDPCAPSARLEENEHPVFAIKADLSSSGELERVIEITLARFRRIDTLINGAGLCVARSIVEDDRAMESADLQFQMNVLVPLKLSKIVFDRFWRDRKHDNMEFNRNIINISSISGVRLVADCGQAVYGATKAALNFLTCSLAQEFDGIGVRVNAVAPNSFPSIVSVADVVEVLKRLDEGSAKGEVIVIDKGTTHQITFDKC